MCSVFNFHKFMQPGDYLCIEDTNPAGPKISGQGVVKELGYEEWGSAKPQEICAKSSRQILG